MAILVRSGKYKIALIGHKQDVDNLLQTFNNPDKLNQFADNVETRQDIADNKISIEMLQKLGAVLHTGKHKTKNFIEKNFQSDYRVTPSIITNDYLKALPNKSTIDTVDRAYYVVQEDTTHFDGLTDSYWRAYIKKTSDIAPSLVIRSMIPMWNTVTGAKMKRDSRYSLETGWIHE